jgi:hypothetical protein
MKTLNRFFTICFKGYYNLMVLLTYFIIFFAAIAVICIIVGFFWILFT